MHLKALLSYDGTLFFGWQKTHAGPSIQAALEELLTRLLGSPISLQASSRTDRGVHAREQVVDWHLPRPLHETRWSGLRDLQRALNALLPPTIRILSIQEAPPSFHPTLDARGKEYHYALCNTPFQLPFHRTFSWHLPLPLRIDAMCRGIPLLVGKRDFSAFSNLPPKQPICSLEEISIEDLGGGRFCIRLIGDRFLYKMARNLVGTLVDVGLGKIETEELTNIVQGRKRAAAGQTAPAQGLFLHKVFFGGSC